ALASSGYNDRRRECEQGVTGLREHLPDIRSLRDVTAAAFERHAWTLPETVRRRCRHVITENERTREAAEALADGELDRVGALMRESHRSLRDDYEVSCRELDHDVALASAVDGVWGSRMTGGGFGGCSVHLVEPAATEGLTHTLLEGHRRQGGIEPDVFVAVPCDGARELT
ncbi:MAG: galactokinase, partial [Myxococcota bacterium]